MITIQNDTLKITSTAKGAELTGILSEANGIEYLWQADPAVWPRHAPVLFPIVGQVENGTYEVDGKRYSLPQHGFARDMEFEVFSESPEAVTYLLKNTEDTLQKYPFRFELHVTYSLDGNTLTTKYDVINTDDKEIFFSIGAHPGFNCPLTKDEKFEDYYLEFDQDETIGKHLLDGGLLSGKTERILENQNKIDVSKDVFKQDALVFKNLKSEKISLKSKTSPHFVSMEFKGFPFYGIWAKPGTDRFVCLEPWNGIASTKGSTPDFKNKEGVLKLEKGKSFSCSFDLIFG